MYKKVNNDNNLWLKRRTRTELNRKHSMFQKVYQTLYHPLRVISIPLDHADLQRHISNAVNNLYISSIIDDVRPFLSKH